MNSEYPKTFLEILEELKTVSALDQDAILSRAAELYAEQQAIGFLNWEHRLEASKKCEANYAKDKGGIEIITLSDEALYRKFKYRIKPCWLCGDKNGGELGTCRNCDRAELN